ncbi:MAG: hypothetical protein KGO96_07465 [Elusimicrobia bacterium]|nr:hypothetical protein [Elusimicrobiota bacterium]
MNEPEIEKSEKCDCNANTEPVIEVHTLNHYAIVLAPERTGVKMSGSGFSFIEQKHSLTCLERAFSNDEFGYSMQIERYIYVKGDAVETQQWAKEVFYLNGKKVVFVPKEAVMASSNIKLDTSPK